MAIDLILSSETTNPLTDGQLDTNFTAIQTAVNSLTPITATTFNTQLILRLQKGSALSNEELDDNFIYLDQRSNGLQLQLDTITQVTIPTQQNLVRGLLGGKQDLNARLTSISSINSNGMMSVANNTVTPRSIVSTSAALVVTNGNGVGGNPSLALSDAVVTTTGSQVLTNKTISGASNTITNVSLTTAVAGTLPVNKGGTNATTQEQARDNLEAMKRPIGVGLVVKTGTDTAVVRNLQVSGVGLSIDNDNAVSSNPVITSNASSSNGSNTIVSRNALGNFSANLITASLNGSISGNASTVTNGVYTNGSYSNPAWIAALAGSKVTNIPNSSLANSSITINGTAVALGGTFVFDIGTALNTSNQIVKRTASGNFAANEITATLKGNADTATSAQTATTAQRLQTARTINSVDFDGTANITITDNTKLALGGGSLTGFLSLHAAPTSAMHAVNKSYVDARMLSVSSGTIILDSETKLFDDVYPPAGKTMASLQGFLPAFGSSSSSTPTYSTNLVIVIDTSGSAFSTAQYNGVTYTFAYQAAAAAAKHLVEYYGSIGLERVCLIEQTNSSSGRYIWTSAADALTRLNNPLTMSDSGGTIGSVITAMNAAPATSAQTLVYFLSDCNHDITPGTAFGGSTSAWQTYLTTKKAISYAVCVDNSGTASFIDEISYDGRLGVDMNGFRALSNSDIPKTASPGLYNTGSIEYSTLSDRVRVSLTMGSNVSNVAINWIAFWA